VFSHLEHRFGNRSRRSHFIFIRRQAVQAVLERNRLGFPAAVDMAGEFGHAWEGFDAMLLRERKLVSWGV